MGQVNMKYQVWRLQRSGESGKRLLKVDRTGCWRLQGFGKSGKILLKVDRASCVVEEIYRIMENMDFICRTQAVNIEKCEVSNVAWNLIGAKSRWCSKNFHDHDEE